MSKEYLNFEIEKSKDGLNILRLYDRENKRFYVGSKYRMNEYIGNILSEFKENIKKESIFIIFGLGSGELIEAIYKEYSKYKIIVIEPNKKLIDFILNGNFNYNFIKDKNVEILSWDELEIKKYLGIAIKDKNMGKINFHCMINYDKVYNNEFIEFNRILREDIITTIINVNTTIYFSETWFETLINNLKFFAESTPLNLYENAYKGIPAIIVSAGPSLIKNIDKLKNTYKDFVILSGGRTLKPLMERKIKPTVVGVIDPGESSYEQVENYIDKCDTTLLFYEGTNTNVIEEHKKEKIFFTKSQTINNVFNMQVKNLAVGGSIAHALTSFAILLGCNPIIFIGQDLAYTNDKLHSDIAVNQFAKDYSNDIQDRNINLVYVEDINGDLVKSSELLNYFRRDLEKIIELNKEVTFINATEGGAKIKGTIQMTLKEVIDKYKKEDINVNGNINNNIKYEKVKENIINLLKDSIKSCKFIIKRCNRASDIIRELNKNVLINNIVNINKNLQELDVIDKEISGKYSKLEMLNTLLYPIVYSIMYSESDDKKDIIEKSKFLYKALLEKTNYALKILEKALKEFER